MDPASGDPNSLSLAFVEGLYLDYLNQPESVPEDWRRYFDSLGESNGSRVAHSPSYSAPSLFNPPAGNGSKTADVGTAVESGTDDLQFLHRVEQLIRNFRVRGHRIAKVDPLGMPRPMIPELVPIYHGFHDEDMDRRIHTRLVPGLKSPRLRHLIEVLQTTYCGSVGAQYMHIDSLAVREWLQERMEGKFGYVKLSREEQLRILTRLTDAVLFEEFIQKKLTRFDIKDSKDKRKMVQHLLRRGFTPGVVYEVLNAYEK